jgi:hypothetical protein
MELASKHKELVNPSDRKTPVNVSMSLRLLDAVDEQAFREFGLTTGARSKVIEKILKGHLNIK